MTDINFEEKYSRIFYKTEFSNSLTKDLLIDLLQLEYMNKKTVLFQSSEYDLINYLQSIGFDNSKSYYDFIHKDLMIKFSIEGIYYQNVKYFYVKKIYYESPLSVIECFIYDEYILYKSNYRKINNNMLSSAVFMEKINALSFNYFCSDALFYLKEIIFVSDNVINISYTKKDNNMNYSFKDLCNILSKDVPKITKDNKDLLVNYFTKEDLQVLDMYTV